MFYQLGKTHFLLFEGWIKESIIGCMKIDKRNRILNCWHTEENIKAYTDFCKKKKCDKCLIYNLYAESEVMIEIKGGIGVMLVNESRLLG